MTDWECPNCRGGFPDPELGECPWCGQAINGSCEFEPKVVSRVETREDTDSNTLFGGLL